MSHHTDWFTHDRFGMFIHWGLYAQPARHEWVMQNEQIAPEVYEKYFRHFDPDLYDPEAWADAAANAGMKYMVITSKHHEGFCLWDTALTDYKAPNTPAKRDLLCPLLDAFRARGLKVGLYHSLIDWHHPDFLIDDLHPLRNHPDRDKLNESRDLVRYQEYLHGQVRELLTQYGKIDIMWYDFSYANKEFRKVPGDMGKGRNEWRSEELLKMTRELQPGIIVDDRLDLSDLPGGWDFRTPEQYVPKDGVKVDGQPVLWEACQTFSGSWGYHRDEASWKSDEQLVQMLIDNVSKGGNLLLNVGPTTARRVRCARERSPGRDGRVDAPALPRDLWLRPRAGGVRHPPGLPPDLQSRNAPALCARLRLALPPPSPARFRGQSRIRPTPTRRLRTENAGTRPQRTGRQRPSIRRSHPPDPRTPGTQTQRDRAGGGAVLEVARVLARRVFRRD